MAELDTRPSMKPSRRNVVRGAAWTVPAVAVAATAPAYAVSATCPPGCPSASFGGGYQLNGWSASSTGTYATGADQRVQFQSSYAPWNGGNSNCTTAKGGTAGGTLNNVILAEADPNAASPTPTISYQKALCLMAGITYTFSFNWNYHGPNLRAAYLDAALLDPNGAIVSGAQRVTAPAQPSNATGSRTISFTPTIDTWYSFRYLWSFATAPNYSTACNRSANDIAVTAPSIACSSTPAGG